MFFSTTPCAFSQAHLVPPAGVTLWMDTGFGGSAVIALAQGAFLVPGSLTDPNANNPYVWVRYNQNGILDTGFGSVSYTHLTLPTIYSV